MAFVWEGGGRAFRRDNSDEYQKPTHTICSQRNNLLAVFEDGSCAPY